MKPKISLKIMLIVAIVMTISSCTDSGTTVGSQTGVISDPAVSDSSTESTDPEPISILDDVLTVDTKPIYLTWEGDVENTVAAQKFKELYGVPEKIPEGYEDVAEDALFVTVSCSYSGRYDTLISLLQSGDPPDIFQFEMENYPNSAYKGLFERVNGLFDFSAKEWDETRDVIDQLKWGTGYYAPVTEIRPYSVLWYRRSLIEGAGLDDPWTLYNDGKWTFDKFMELCRAFTDTENGKYAIDGWNFEDDLVCMTGNPLIALEDGQVVSHLYDTEVEEFIETLRLFDDEQEGLRYPREVVNGWNTNSREWNAGNILFYRDGIYAFEGSSSVGAFYRAHNDWAEDEVQFVPYPKYDAEGEYYHHMNVSAYVLPAGAENTDGYKAWVYANLLTAQDEEMQDAFLKDLEQEYKMPEYISDNIRQVTQPETFTPLFDVRNGISPFFLDTICGDDPLQTLTFYPVMLNESYSSVRDDCAALIEKFIDDINAAAD